MPVLLTTTIVSNMRFLPFVFSAVVMYWSSQVIANLHHGITADPTPYSTRVHWMRKANEALSLLSGPCPFAAFGTAIVDHTTTTSDGLGELVCIGINQNSKTGNPTLHGKSRKASLPKGTRMPTYKRR